MKRGNEGRLTNGVKDKSKYVKLNSLYPLRAMKALLMIALVYGKHINSPRQLRRPQNMLGGTIHSKVMPLLEQKLIHQNQVITAAMQFLQHGKYFLKGYYVKKKQLTMKKIG
jgi:cell division protein YceG involved in septum cleavage